MNLSPSEIEDLYKKAKQRLEIVEKYERGPVVPQPVDWDDPNSSMYRQCDLFGFIYRRGVPDDIREANECVLKRDTQRVDKWLQLLPRENMTEIVDRGDRAFTQSDWTRRHFKKQQPSEKLRRYVYKGIPRALRGRVWRLLLNLPMRIKEQEHIYKGVWERARERSPDIYQIDLDVNRTFRDHVYFYEPRNPRQGMLFQVLAAYSLYNTEVGYCQGMSGIAALMILFLNEEEEVFWALSQLFTEERWSMHGFFTPHFPKLMRLVQHHEEVLRQMLPKLWRHFERLGIQTTAYAVKWFMQCFLDRLPLTLTLRVWDIFLIEGDRLLIGFAYTILKHFKDKFVRMDEGEILIFLQEDMPNRYVQPDDAWIKELEANLEELRRKKLDRAGKPSDAEQPSRPFNPPNAGSPSLAELTAMRRHAGAAVQQMNGRMPQETYM